MDNISELPDALLLRILSLLPARDVMATMVLSKRWKPLWMMVTKLTYDDSYQNLEYARFSRFVDRSLLLHEAPLLETLHFKLGLTCGAEDIRVWIRAADKCSVRELIIEFDNSRHVFPAILPRSLFTGCTRLVTLKINNVTLVDVVDSLVSFPSLKTLDLLDVKYPGDESVQMLLSNCHVLEDLVVERCPDDNVTIFTVKVPSLKSLVLHKSYFKSTDIASGFVIDAPSLECLDIVDYDGEFCVVENEMPDILEADICVAGHPWNYLSSITSVKRLSLCISYLKDVYPLGTVFHCLVHLKICTSETEWLNLLMCLLRDSPKLQSLKLKRCHVCRVEEPRPCWIKPSSVPECLLSSLESFEWVRYEGTEEEKALVAFILRNGSCLKNVTISSDSTDRDEKLEMLKELTLTSRRSPTCELAFH